MAAYVVAALLPAAAHALSAEAAAAAPSLLRGGIPDLDRRSLNALQDFLADQPLWTTLIIYIGISLGGLACIICTGILIRRRCNANRDVSMVANPYVREWTREAGGATLIRKNVGTASPALADFMKQNPAARGDDPNAPPPVPTSSKPGKKKDAAAMAALSKRVSTQMTGEDYGRLQPEVKDRLRSIRMEGNLKPIGVAKPSAKALKMLGVEADAIQRPFDDDIQTRMERVAKGAGGGIYSPGLATARLGGQIAEGFKQRRAQQLEKAAQRKEREEERRREREERERARAGAEPSKPKPPPVPSTASKPKPMAPGPDKLQAFLGASAVRDDDDDDDENDDDEDDDDNEDDVPKI